MHNGRDIGKGLVTDLWDTELANVDMSTATAAPR
ncbi:hypothetical protein C1752_00904 [Acaryochloris thomasi RCC1774]|uniref:Uncharacterized protein n=1 Tax=Acaryochloris thomasi RCC1774 TaxID=1764569 RepID=A0A2W1K058_9CYAN|nr:hypothetical protein C1752_00904 [Acaryochloris thomasi RCC1774]